ncbi:hypothetical protein RND71_036213 [Anisodus tanguticus]|uniref:Protein phosphatase n=1 Tax=Anisodus tanguticus TaxID=243964 RepID=A0AAE1R931_9SOLA|nr:hypothetical protein RND71_036213 [Anisodus tanguticus]
MAACISSLGHNQYSSNKFDEVFKLPQYYKRYFDFSCYEINDQLGNHSNKRLKISHGADQDFKFSTNTSLGHFDEYSVKKVDEYFKINERLEFSSNKLPCLKMVAASLYLPKENPNKPLGEDAHFIHELYQTIGVADGVGGWAKKGIDAGIYARELMKNSLIATNNEPKGHVNPKRVLQEAYKNTNSEGSSTACIITLNSDKNTLLAANVGDSGFFLIRKGKIMYKSPIQQQGFSYPYQLGNSKDNPSVAQEMELIVEKDDILIVGTDGMLDNMNESEIEEIVQRAIDEKLKAEELASQIGNIALYNSFDRFADTPFAREAEREWLSQIHKGGKIDDITVIVAYIQHQLVFVFKRQTGPASPSRPPISIVVNSRSNKQFEDTGRVREFFQQIVYDQLPSYCKMCKHQGHVEDKCWSKVGTRPREYRLLARHRPQHTMSL